MSTVIKVVLVVGGIALAIAAIIIFFLWEVLKNTLQKLYAIYQENEEILELRNALDNFENNVAYDGEYYPGHLLLSVERNNEDDSLIQIMDFSYYENYKIMGCVIKCNRLEEEQYGEYQIPGVVVFQPMEGVWTWKLQWE